MTDRLGPRFDPRELIGADGADEPELGALAGVARDLDRLGADDPAPSAGFVDRVMTAVATEPAPRPVVAAGRAIRDRRPSALMAALADAWRVAMGTGRPLALRAQAGALLLVAMLASGVVAGGAMVGAASLLTPAPSPAPVVSPSPSPSPSPSASDEASPLPSPSDEASATPSEEPSETPEASGSPEPTNDANATSSPIRTAEPTRTPEPTGTQTPEPTKTPDPTQSPTPEPTSSGDSGGGSGG